MENSGPARSQTNIKLYTNIIIMCKNLICPNRISKIKISHLGIVLKKNTFY